MQGRDMELFRTPNLVLLEWVMWPSDRGSFEDRQGRGK